MRGLIDSHMHTRLCGHATGTVGQMVGAAVFRGLSGIVITEHLPLPEELDPDNTISMRACDLEDYADEVRSMADRAKGITVVLGAEADWLPNHIELAEDMRNRAAELGVQVLLGSVHYIEDWAFDDPTRVAEWENRDVDEVWRDYFERWCDAAGSGLFDVMAHPDLVKKFGHRPSFDPRYLYEQAAKAAADAGVIVELSTAGLRKPVGEMYPSADMLAALFSAGVDMTVGSDAHAADEVGYGIEDAYRVLADTGFTRVALPLGRGERAWYEL